MTYKILWLTASFLFGFVLFCSAEETQTAKSPQAPCRASSEFRQFDFWIGEWEVYEKGKKAGDSSIQLILDDCVIFENWTGVSGYKGKSFNLYNAATKKWQQLWVDSGGGVLQLEGEYKDGKLEYRGETPMADGTTVQERLTFYKLPERRVRQVWDQSKDGGKTWTNAFDGLYQPKK